MPTLLYTLSRTPNLNMEFALRRSSNTLYGRLRLLQPRSGDDIEQLTVTFDAEVRSGTVSWLTDLELPPDLASSD